MSKSRPSRTTVVAALAAAALLSGCDVPAPSSRDMASTDDFVRNALDAYGVISVAPSAPIQTGPTTAPSTAPPVQPPLVASQSLTLDEVCRGRSGLQTDYVDDRTGQPIDCGPEAPPSV